jgi:glyoxylase I family protein
MVVEHIGISVSNPFEMAKWYRDNLGFNIIYSSEGDPSTNEMAFIGDEIKSTVIEVFQGRPVSDQLSDPIALHIALLSDSPEADRDRLVAHGAVFVKAQPTAHEGETLLLLHDPFGNVIQLVKRGKIKIK